MLIEEGFFTEKDLQKEKEMLINSQEIKKSLQYENCRYTQLK